jgi:acetyl-CoA synthetase
MPSVEPYVLSEDGLRTREGEKGFLCVKGTWPGMMLTINNDPARYKEVYFSRFPGYYYSGDYAIQDEEGYFWLLGRADEVLKVSGHRLGTIEIEDALVSVDGIAEAAVFGKPDTVKGDAIVAFVVLREGHHKNPDFVTQTKKVIRESLGPITVPDEIHVVNNLPKTRSGKIMRRVLKAIYLNQVPGDVSTLESGATVDEIKEAMELFRKQNRDLL